MCILFLCLFIPYSYAAAPVAFYNINGEQGTEPGDGNPDNGWPYPLEITNIKPAGTGSPAISANNRIFKAYPGVEYNIRAAVIGGLYPYTFSLSNAPAGMQIQGDNLSDVPGKPGVGEHKGGEIWWPDPQSDSGEITLTVTDSLGTTVTTGWSITVTTNDFIFIDANNGSPQGDGTKDSPYQDLSDLYGLDGENVVDQKYILYFRQGVEDNSYNLPQNIYLRGRANKWIGYPGEQAEINMNQKKIITNNYGCSGKPGCGPNIGRSNDAYFDNLYFTNMLNHGMTGSIAYHTIRRSDFSNIITNINSNGNQGFLYVNGGKYMVLQDSEWHEFYGTAAIGSLYTKNKWGVV